MKKSSKDQEWFREFYVEELTELVGFPSPEATEQQVRFVLDKLMLPHQAKILDLCCGYGRVTHLLSRDKKYQITGFDLSEDFLEIARSEFSSPNIKYVQGDIRKLPFKNEFDAVVNLFTSFGYFDSDEENEKILTQINKALKKGGLFLLDYENKFNFVMNEVMKKKRSWYNTRNHQLYLIENEYDFVKEREIVTFRQYKDGFIVKQVCYNIRLFSFPELEKMLARNGFEILQRWGDFEGGPLTVESKRVITLSRKVTPGKKSKPQ
ncbi:MAG TPA: methyltransferase domain-containing protein [Acidobacteriota bacterium]